MREDIQSLYIQRHGNWADKESVFVNPITCEKCGSKQFRIFTIIHAAFVLPPNVCFECVACGWKSISTDCRNL